MPRKSKHPGVTTFVRRRPGGQTHYARWTDPITGDPRDTNLSSLGLANAGKRRLWCEAKSRWIQALKAKVASGGGYGSTPVREAIATYLDDAKLRLREKSYATYKRSLENFCRWSDRQGPEVIEFLRADHLTGWRDSLIAHGYAPRGVNTRMSHAQAALNWLRRRRYLPLLDSPHLINEALQSLRAPKPQPNWIPAEDLGKVLLACQPVELPVVLFYLLAGVRASEGLALRWDGVLLRHGLIRLTPEQTKTRAGRTIDLSVSRALVGLLRAQLGQRTGSRVLDGWTESNVRYLRQRVAKASGVAWSLQRLRQTCASYLTNAPGIFGAASVFRSAVQMGHSVQVAEQHYLGLIPGIPHEAKTLEAAMQIDQLPRVRDLITKARSAP